MHIPTDWFLAAFRCFSYFVAAHWFIVSCYAILGFAGFALYRGTKKSFSEERNLQLCVVSKASKDVEDQLVDNISYHSRMFQGYRINVLVDEGCHSLSRLKNLADKYEALKLVVVPRKFRPRAIAKGRAIQYFIENLVEDETWYAFIDDDNRILDRRFLKEIPYYDCKGYGAGNGVLVPRTSGNILTYVADSLRYFDDLTIFRFGSGLCKTPLNGFHGELLLSKGRHLRTVSFDRKTVTEDFSYARELMKKDVKVWQSETRISILSPFTVSDFLKQRNRWYRGISKDFRSSNLKMKLFVGIRVIDWKIGIIGSWVVFPLWFFMPIPLWLVLFNFVGSLYYYAAYVCGALKLGCSVRSRIFGIVCIPAYSVMETLSPWVKTNGFNVIDKNGNNHCKKGGIRYL